MYLKSIEVHGFKSFANKLKFEFPTGITGIVGPNGSGKSNVADAVRWVLGEQSAKQLRSGNMQDVIFAGTEVRKPQSFASVAITFDNSDHRLDVDYEEVTVTRRLYRSGESEYLLNNTNVRLKDINEIFYDTGIGQEGYSIIGQGQIDRILSGKSEERRELFDEAAGIVKFKRRKRAALKKLDDEHQNLLRVSDILKELTAQLGPLKKQSETARVYLEEKAKLKDLDINLFMIEDERTSMQLTEVTGRMDTVEAEMAETRTKFDRTKAEYEEIEARIEEISSEINSLTEKASGIAVVRQQLIGQKELLEEQIRASEAAGRQYGERQVQIARERGEKQSEIEDLEQLLASPQEDLDLSAKEKAVSDRLSSIDADIQDTVAGIEYKKNEVISMLEDRASVRGKMQRYGTMLEQLEIRRSEIHGRLLRLKETEEKALAETGSLTQEFTELQERAAALEAEEKDCSLRLEALRGGLAEVGRKLDESTASFHRDSSRLESLRAMAEHYEGYGNAIRRVMEMKKRNPGIRGVVADIIDAPREYEIAIETALGGSIRNIVTDNDSTAKYLIEFLKTNKLGRATFLPLTSMKPRRLNGQEVLGEDGVIGTASSLVTCEGEYRDLCEFLLGRVVVVDTIDHAIAIGRKYRHSVYMVTLQGESFAPGGSITGGAFRNSDNLLGRKRDIEELETRTKTLSADIRKLQGQDEALRNERNACRDRLTGTHEERQKLQLRLNTIDLTRKQADEQISVSRLNAGALQKELDGIDRQIQDVREKNTGIESALKTSETSETEINREAARLREREEALRAEREACARELESVRVETAQLAEKKNYRRETCTRLRREIEDLDREAAVLASSLTHSAGEAEEKRRQIAEVEETLKAGEGESGQVEQARAEAAERKRKLSDSQRDFFAKREELSEHMNLLDREYFRLTSQREKFENGREERSTYMWDEYNLTPSEARKYPLAVKRDDRSALMKDIKECKGVIRKLGNVNVNAIEDYKSVVERHDFLSAQHDDLVKSERTLMGIINELDEGMRRQFTEKIAEIRREFDLAFQELFGGGRGTIEIEAEADILEAGISIIAHPPGKKLQNMLQLSGGEKALTAIALLFAIQNLKPSPFCLLDEIEAALDENNVVRFAGYLHKLTKNTQFIIITHRRGTMTAADRLYGITMQEKGVSTMVSVNLIEDKLQ